MAKKSKKSTLAWVLVAVLVLGVVMMASGHMLANRCDHDFENGVCVECDYECEHKDFDDGVCSDCEYECEHDFDKDGVCEVCGIDEADVETPEDETPDDNLTEEE